MKGRVTAQSGNAMRIQFLFNSSGQWIAFRQGKYVYNTEGEWIGWLPWDDDDVVDITGGYLGTIDPNNRFYRLFYRMHRAYPEYPGFPGYLGYLSHPGFAGYAPLPSNAEDISELEAQ